MSAKACITRSAHYGKPMPHKFTAKQRVNGIETIHCTWCWRASAQRVD